MQSCLAHRFGPNPSASTHLGYVSRYLSPWKYRRKPGTTGGLLLCSGSAPCETKTEATTTVHLRRIEEKEHVCIRGGPRLCRRDRGVDGAGATQWVSSGAPMPGVPERSAAEEGQRDAGLWGELRPNRARPRRRQRPPRQ